MKILKSKFPLLLISIYLAFFVFKDIICKLTLNRNVTKNILTFNSKKSQEANLRSFSLKRDSHLIAKCPESTVLVKIIFEKRVKSDRIDVGFNCRTEDYKIVKRFETKIDFLNFDDITPPEMKCVDNSVFTGFELKKLNNQVQFIWHCGLFRELGKHTILKSNMFVDEKNNNYDSTKFTEFLIHTDIKVDDQQKQGIQLIKFDRSKVNKNLNYIYHVNEIISNNNVKN